MNSIDSAYNYNDLAGLNAITKQSATDKSGALREVARQYESMFVGMMLKSMREANAVFEEDNPLLSNESKFYRQMFDDQLVLSLSKGKGMGLADTLYRQLKEQFDNKEAANDSSLDSDKNAPFGLKQNVPLNPFEKNTQFKNKEAVQLEDSEILQVEEFGLENKNSEIVRAPIADQAIGKNISKLQHNEEKDFVEKKNDQINTSAPVSKQSAFETPQDFVSKLWPFAQKVADEIGVEAKAIMAQAALETGWGKHIIHQSNGDNSHNLFGIKADRRWNGEVAKVSTLEYKNGLAKKEVAPFRVYDSYESSLKDYGRFVKDSERYQSAISNGKSVKGYSEGLQDAGYATDPNYAKKIQRIAGGDILNQVINDIKRG
ncbi:MAG: flagellar assembly peptidoglycan hydrolase FlgJ [Bermanella sp.]